MNLVFTQHKLNCRIRESTPHIASTPLYRSSSRDSVKRALHPRPSGRGFTAHLIFDTA